MLAVILFFNLFIPNSLFAEDLPDCSVAVASGWVRVNKNKLELVISEKSNSELRLHFSNRVGIKLFGYRNRFILANIEIRNPAKATEADVLKLNDFQLARPRYFPEQSGKSLVILRDRVCDRIDSPPSK